MSVRVIQGDCRAVLPTLPDASVQMCVTSPPYFGLRDYGEDEQIGREPTVDSYVAHLVAVFREVMRVLRDDGVLFLNLGDSYANDGKWGGSSGGKHVAALHGDTGIGRQKVSTGLKPKDLIGIPWRLAFALQQPYEHVVLKNHADRAWLAAMIDGEGCITTTVAQPTTGLNESYAIVLQVRMSDRQCLDRIVEITGMSKVQAEVLSPSMMTGNQRPAFAWKVAGENAATLLAEIYPYLHIKRQQAIVAWNLQRLKDGVTTKRGVPVPAENMALRRDLHHMIRALNQREDVLIPSWCREPEFVVEPGWYLRSDVIWAKPNPMPESVRDRPTKSHEYIFLLTKKPRYFWNAEAVKETQEGDGRKRGHVHTVERSNGTGRNDGGREWQDTGSRNIRSVWTIATMPFKEAHFATFPPALAERCIKAGSAVGDMVLDPFAGAGTVGLVAGRLGRDAILIELNSEYAAMARKRIYNDAPMFAEVR